MKFAEKMYQSVKYYFHKKRTGQLVKFGRIMKIKFLEDEFIELLQLVCLSVWCFGFLLNRDQNYSKRTSGEHWHDTFLAYCYIPTECITKSLITKKNSFSRNCNNLFS